MLRFRCPACGKTLKVPESLAGRKVACPRCHEPALAPVPAPEPEPQAESADEAPGFFSSMSTRLRLAVALVVVGGVLGLLAPVLRPLLREAAWVSDWGLAVALASFLALLTMLHGHGTNCPCCGAWWSRDKVRSEVAERQVFHRDGAAVGRSMTLTEFKCRACSHAWSVTDSEEYPVSERS